MNHEHFVGTELKGPPTIVWPIRVIGVLLFLQAGMIMGVTAYFVRQVNWEYEFNDLMLSLPALDILLWGATLAPITLLLMVSAIAFLLHRRFAWLLTMILQGLILLRCIILYFGTDSSLRESPWIHLLMLYSIVLVLYLNTTDIRLAFTPENGHVST